MPEPYVIPDLDTDAYWAGGKAASRGGQPYVGPFAGPSGPGGNPLYGQQQGRLGGFSEPNPQGDVQQMMIRRWYGSQAMGAGKQRGGQQPGQPPNPRWWENRQGGPGGSPGGLPGGNIPEGNLPGGSTYGPQQGGGSEYDPRYWNNIGTGAGDIQDFNRFIAQFIHGYSPQGGPFQVGGDPNVRAFMDAQMQQKARGMQGQALTAANAMGVDPAQRQWMQMQALMGGQGAGANALSQYAAASNTANDDLRRSFLDALHASNLGLQRQNNQGAWQQIIQGMNRPSAWDYFAGIGGRALGGLLP